MHEYYFKIRKGDIEFEFSTTDKTTFEQQLADWINGLVNGKHLAAPGDENDKPSSSQRDGFINVKALSSINDMTVPSFDFSDTKEERIAEFLRQIKNPYCFKCGKFTVQAQFSPNGVSLEDCLKQILI